MAQNSELQRVHRRCDAVTITAHWQLSCILISLLLFALSCWKRGVQCAFTCILHSALLHCRAARGTQCAKCNVSSLHNYIALVAGTVTKEAVDVHFKAPCLSLGQSLNVHFKPDGAVIVDHSYEEQCLQCNEMTIFNALHLHLKGRNCTQTVSQCIAVFAGHSVTV